MRPFEEPAVAGDRLLVSHADFERSCFVLLWQEQQKPLPNNAIIATLCNAVRLSREHCEMMGQPIRKQSELQTILREAHALLNSHELEFRLPAVPWRDRRDQFNAAFEKLNPK